MLCFCPPASELFSVLGEITPVVNRGERNDDLSLQKLKMPGTYLSSLPRSCGSHVGPTRDVRHLKTLACEVVTLQHGPWLR